jgi:hypothetical protein
VLYQMSYFRKDVGTMFRQLFVYFIKNYLVILFANPLDQSANRALPTSARTSELSSDKLTAGTESRPPKN